MWLFLISALVSWIGLNVGVIALLLVRSRVPAPTTQRSAQCSRRTSLSVLR